MSERYHVKDPVEILELTHGQITVVDVLEFEEGYSDKAYLCSENYPTIGIGHRLSSFTGNLNSYKGMHWDRAKAEEELEKDLQSVFTDIRNSTFYGTYKELSYDQQVIISSMVFQMGVKGVTAFKLMWADLVVGNWKGASLEMLDSRWAGQTPGRAGRHSRVMYNETLQQVYWTLVK